MIEFWTGTPNVLGLASQSFEANLPSLNSRMYIQGFGELVVPALFGHLSLVGSREYDLERTFVIIVLSPVWNWPELNPCSAHLTWSACFSARLRT